MFSFNLSKTVLAGILLGFLVVSYANAQAARATPKLKILIPAYFDPGKLWDQLINITSQGKVSITAIVGIFINDSPTLSIQPSYVKTLAKFQQAGGKVLGYVHTCSAVKCPYAPYQEITISAALDEAKKYLDWYSGDGIFIDEMSYYVKDLPYYVNLSSALRHLTTTKSLILVGNPGTNTNVQYLQTVDTLVTYESGVNQFLSTSVESWAFSHSPSAQASIVYGVSSPAKFPALISRALARNDGYIYLTSAGLPNPYGDLGKFFPQFVAAVEQS